jgi:hypothetical protein
LCGYDAPYYGKITRCIEGLNICLGCFLQINGSDYGMPYWHDLELQFICHSAWDSRIPAFAA